MGLGQRIGMAFRAFFSLLSSGTVPSDIAAAAASASEGAAAHLAEPDRMAPQAPAPVTPLPAERAADGAVQVLALLQRDARLLDFLMEDLAGYPDAQVGAAVREVHGKARQTLAKYLEVEPVLDGAEDQPVALPVVDPDQVKLVGRVVSGSAVRGTLRHRGWRAGRVQLPALAPPAARQIIAPAEVEVA